jgi:ribosomal protein S18 acetylase RimI-like enzyme
MALGAHEFELLGKHHDRADFSCGEPSLDTYLKQRATQDIRRRLAYCYILCESGQQSILGYYTLSAASVDLTDLEPAVARKLPRCGVVPATLIGRLAIDQRYQGRGLGAILLVDAAKRTAETSAAAALMIVDALNAKAEEFYKHFGFVSLSKVPQRLYLPLPDVRKYFNG